MIIDKDFQQTIEDSFLEYASYVAVDRALPDVRDMLKVGARQILYSQFKEKLTYDKPFKKAQKTVAAAMSLAYVHGDSSAYGTAIRMGKPFIYRYPLEDIQGAYGNPCAADNHSASRYVEMRSSELSKVFTEDINKNTINKWINNYDDTEKIPTVFCSKGYYNIVNGCSGIGVTLATSIPQFNLKEVNNALIKLLQNPDIDFNEIYCPPDYASGGIIINGNEVKESLCNGKGKSITIRAKINYNQNKHMLQVLEIPAGVFTNTICSQIGQLIEENPECGIERLIDATKEDVDIRIYLNKKANPKKIEQLLYEKTSLQYHYGINMMMLDRGVTPKLFTWKEALQAHINHEKEVYRRGFEFDLSKIEHRIHIINGLLICLASIDEVVKTIKESPSTNAANIALQKNFLLDDEQAKAVLALKLASLAKLEVKKLEEEKIKLTEEANRIKIILQNEKEFNQQLINGWNEISKKFGDARRTIVYNSFSDNNEQEKTIKNVKIYINNKADFIVKEDNRQLSTYKRGKIKFIMSGTIEENFYVFTKFGRCYCVEFEKLEKSKEGNLRDFLNLEDNEEIIFCGDPSKFKEVTIVTKNGMIKKMEISEIISIKKNKLYITLLEDDCVVEVLFGNGDENIAIASNKGNVVVFDNTVIGTTKLPSRGIIGIKFKEDKDEVTSAALVHNYDKYLCSITSAGFIKKTGLEEYPLTARGTKGRLVCKLNDDEVVEIKTLDDKEEILHSKAFGEIPVDSIPTTNRVSRGIDLLKM